MKDFESNEPFMNDCTQRTHSSAIAPMLCENTQDAVGKKI
ncbi:hypothetical protein J2T20_004459 [Paenibacillus wynnii]|nr:hypothetical protein [Paenibacillus wynnii]